jgi:hypothetical protein
MSIEPLPFKAIKAILENVIAMGYTIITITFKALTIWGTSGLWAVLGIV